jgi:hypothetical protein
MLLKRIEARIMATQIERESERVVSKRVIA